MKIYTKINPLIYRHIKIYSILRTVYETMGKIIGLFYYLFRIFPIQNNKIVLDNYCGGKFGDNAKYIANELLKEGDKYNIIWLIQKKYIDNSNVPDKIKLVKYGSISSIYHLTTAKVWVDNVRKPGYTKKRTGQYYIQTWHGFGPKKTLNVDKYFVPAQINAFKYDSNITDIYISNSQRYSQLCRDDFWYHGDILECGFPRNDILFNGDSVSIKEKICTEFNIPPNRKLILFAPTFRDDFNLDKYTLDYVECIKSMSKRFGGEWTLLLRLHHFMADKSDELARTNSLLINVSNYLDMQELLLVSDVLITDYSSCMFDFALTRKPCFLYLPDLNDYDTTRGFCIPPIELPFPRALTNAELREIIENFDDSDYQKNLNECFERYQVKENGTACKAVVAWMEERMTFKKMP